MGFFRSFKRVWDVTIPLLQINALRPACLSPWWQIHYPKLHVHSYKEAKEDPWFLLRNIQMRFPLLVYSQCNATWFCYIGKLFLEEHAMIYMTNYNSVYWVFKNPKGRIATFVFSNNVILHVTQFHLFSFYCACFFVLSHNPQTFL